MQTDILGPRPSDGREAGCSIFEQSRICAILLSEPMLPCPPFFPRVDRIGHQRPDRQGESCFGDILREVRHHRGSGRLSRRMENIQRTTVTRESRFSLLCPAASEARALCSSTRLCAGRAVSQAGFVPLTR